MLESIKRWFSASAGQTGSAAVADWARGAGYKFKRTRSADGFAIEARPPGPGWRLEWGAAQRKYISGPELRMRAGLNGGDSLQMLVVSRSLMELLEKQVFEQFTEGLQTRADTDTPEEMRWLVLYPKQPQFELKGLRDAFGAVANASPALSQWLAGPLSVKLAMASKTWLAPEDPLAFIVHRGRLTMRHALPRFDVARVAALVDLYETALTAARQVAESWGGSSSSPSTHPSLWSGPGGPAPGEPPA